MNPADSLTPPHGIAVIGMAGRFPGARNVEEFWQNLRSGRECISFFSEEELIAEGIDPAIVSSPSYVKAGAILEGIEWFDASFFGLSPREAELTDPQQRVFLEHAWEALENAGYDSSTYSGPISVYAGVGMNTYLLTNLLPHPGLVGIDLQTAIAHDKDFLSTRASYKLDLKGPSLTVQTSCSTSLVAVHLAYQSLLARECDVALAGGILVTSPRKAGYLYHTGGIYSPDGHCRAFDASAQGTVGGRGVGIVVLKRLADALADGDRIRAVIRGSAVNNDGAAKVGYTAPSVEGQAAVIAEALAVAGVDAETVTYVETHGTGTPLGDPIEIAALTKVFRASTDKNGFCAIGSVKTNVGHLDAAAGVTGLIKAVLSLEHGELPPSLHFEEPNPEIDLPNSPFYVNTALREWKAGESPRRAGVSSFGIGGTNAHVVLEEAPPRELSGESRPSQLLVLSAKTESALERATTNLADDLKRHPEANLADVAYTLKVGRQRFGHRRVVVCQDRSDALAALQTLDGRRVFTEFQEARERPVAFMFPGQGAQYPNMAAGLYEGEPIFREHVDQCARLLEPRLAIDLRRVLYPREDEAQAAADRLRQTAVAQLALFVIEYALARLWMAWGVRPEAMIGHSVGEYAAACLAGVFSLEDALALLATRGRLMQLLPEGTMLAVPLPAQELEPLLGEHLSFAAVNEPSLCVVSGSTDAVARLETRLAEQAVASHRLLTSHAFHSKMIDPILEPFGREVSRIQLDAPRIPYVSNLTGTWIRAAEATDPGYWVRHLRETVRYAAGVGQLLKDPALVLLEVGPGRTLTASAGRHPDKALGQVILSSTRHPHAPESDVAFLLNTVGRLWLAGARIDWSGFYSHERRHRVPLPTYPFERQRYWIDPPKRGTGPAPAARPIEKQSDIADWLYHPSWRRSAPLVPLPLSDPADQTFWLVFLDASGIGERIVKRLEDAGRTVFAVQPGSDFARVGDRLFAVNPGRREDYDAVLSAVSTQDRVPQRILHLWGVGPSGETPEGIRSIEQAQALGFHSLLCLAQAVVNRNLTQPLQVAVVTTNAQDVTGQEALSPERATVLGPCKVIPQEYPSVTCRSIDLEWPRSGVFADETVDRLLAELAQDNRDLVVAYRGPHRWVQAFERLHRATGDYAPAQLRDGGVYLITGGLGNVGLALAGYLAQRVRARLVLTGRSGLPPREEWERRLATFDADDDLNRKIGRVLALEALGSEVMIARADVANLNEMQAVVDQAARRFGTIHGVVHAAGVMAEKSFRGIRETGPTECEWHFRPKVLGLLVLNQLLRERPLDFCLLVSSLASVLGGLRFVAYSAANLFMDAFAQKSNRDSPWPWISVNWDNWRFPDEEWSASTRGAPGIDLAMTPDEGVRVCHRVLSLGPIGQVVVSTGPLDARIERSIVQDAAHAADELRPGDLPASHPRPELPQAYAPPRNELERAIAETWQALLGIQQIGVYDNFFDLGGHSLLAMQVIARLERSLGVRMNPGDLVSQTLGQLAAACEERKRLARPPAPPSLTRRLLGAAKSVISPGSHEGP